MLPRRCPTLKNLGMVGIKSQEGRYLQAHTDGELHSSNEKRNQEETWFLIEVDKDNHIYALQSLPARWSLSAASAVLLCRVPRTGFHTADTQTVAPARFPSAVPSALVLPQSDIRLPAIAAPDPAPQ